MKILDVESKTGLTRANIRFYEKEGLIEVERSKNGYRDYTEENVDNLLKIKLLRHLDVPLDEITQLQKNEVALSDVLKEQLEKISAEMEKSQRSKEICESIYKEGTNYQELNATKYLSEMERKVKQKENATTESVMELKRDVIKEEAHPWIRFLARSFDGFFYIFLVWIVYYLIFGNRPNDSRAFNIITVVISMGLTILLEPVFLSTLGTTPGKWIYGISIKLQDGRNLSYFDAFIRTGRVLFYGQAFCIPVIHQFSYWRCYIDYKTEKRLSWDEDNGYEYVYNFKDTKKIRFLANIALEGVIYVLKFFILVYAFLPENKGNISIKEYAENYNIYAKDNMYNIVYSDYDYCYLDQEGKWKVKSYEHLEEPYDEYVYGEDRYEPGGFYFPEFVYTEENGILTSVSFEYKRKSKDESDPSFWDFKQDIKWAIYSYVCAQPGIGIKEFLEIDNKLTDELEHNGSFEETMGGVSISWEIEDYVSHTEHVSLSMKKE